jgi:selenium-binding protein 1
MRRREFLGAAAAAMSAPVFARRGFAADDSIHASPKDAMQAPRETLAFVPCIHVGSPPKKPDYMAVVDVDPKSKQHGQVVGRAHMPSVGDELHHYGWNACASCHGDPSKARRYLIVPGLVSSRIHVLDAADPRRRLNIVKVIEPEEVKKAGFSAPHTVHCLADGHIMISTLGNANGEAPGGFLLLDEKFNIAGRWEKLHESSPKMQFNYDFWYQPRHNVMISSQWAAPSTVRGGFKPDDVKAGKYGHGLHVWDWSKREIVDTIDLGEGGLIPLEVRFHHNPDSAAGFVGAALSSAIWRFHKHASGKWKADSVVQVEPVEHAGWPFPVPGLITDLVLSLDDRWLYFSNWLHGDIRQYEVSDPQKPRLAGQIWLGGLLGDKGGTSAERRKKFVGGPQMLQLSLDGRRLYVTSSLYTPWDDQFYPDIAKRGSYLARVDCDTNKGGLSLDESFHVDFGKEPGGPVRAHEVRFPGGDSTSDIWV